MSTLFSGPESLPMLDQAPESLEQRLDAIATALAKIQEDRAQLLQVFEEINQRYRREVDEYSAERNERRMAVKTGAVLRVVAVALLAYIAFKLT